MKLDEKTVIPIGWALSGLIASLSGSIIGAFWVFTVDARLERIEERLGIPPLHAKASLIENADAGERRHAHP